MCRGAEVKHHTPHAAAIYISREEFDRVNRLLAIESLEDMTDDELLEQGADTNQREGIYCVKFDDGSSINFDLCSGQHNYWDDVVWTSSDGSHDVVLDCAYELGNIEAEIENEFYVVKLKYRSNNNMQRFNINWTAKALVNQMEKGKVNYDNAVQRNLVWDVEKKSLLTHSMIYGYAIPAMYFTRDENGVYDSLDGKQRSNAISEFLHDEFALSIDTPAVVDDNGCVENVSGLYFSQLPEWARDRIKDYNLTIYYYEGMTDTEIREFFRRLNNGKPLSSIELTRANVPSLTIFQQLARHKAIQFVVSEAGRKRFTDEMIAMQLYQLITEESPDFSTKPFREWASKVEIDSETLDTINSGLDAYMVFARSLMDVNNKVLRTIKGRTHFISCAYYCCLGVEHGVNQDEINRTLTEFFSGHPSVSAEYNHTVSAGSAKPTSVQTRRDVMRSLLPAAEEGEADLEEVNPNASEQFEEGNYAV